MAYVVERVGNRYRAEVSAPHSDKPWATRRPRRRGSVRRALIARGLHVQDATHLVDEVDALLRKGLPPRATIGQQEPAGP